jgi:hypothetical protein
VFTVEVVSITDSSSSAFFQLTASGSTGKALAIGDDPAAAAWWSTAALASQNYTAGASLEEMNGSGTGESVAPGAVVAIVVAVCGCLALVLWIGMKKQRQGIPTVIGGGVGAGARRQPRNQGPDQADRSWVIQNQLYSTGGGTNATAGSFVFKSEANGGPVYAIPMAEDEAFGLQKQTTTIPMSSNDAQYTQQTIDGHMHTIPMDLTTYEANNTDV